MFFKIKNKHFYQFWNLIYVYTEELIIDKLFIILIYDTYTLPNIFTLKSFINLKLCVTSWVCNNDYFKLNF